MSRDLYEVMKEVSPYVLELVERMSPSLQFKAYPPNSKFSFGTGAAQKCIIIRGGLVTVHLDADQLMLGGVLTGPTILGLCSLKTDQVQCALKTRTACQMAIVTMDEVYAILAKENIWELFARHLQVLSNKFLLNTYVLIAENAYSLIRHQLFELMHEPESFRAHTPVEHYIRDKTRLSRSGIMSILSKLKQGGYVVIEKGILISINKLPLKY
ncbi:helix-turn-helix domain-containing protein [Lelliottia sp.]|uniref:winged helix-turn-helix transcriptional regulator n=1 Tax=Lelliottia sp. TaxID=1898429 RepID=UPI00388FC8F5